MSTESRHARAALLIRAGGFEGTRFEITSDETLIGRNPNTDITLLDDGISREHAILLFDGDGGEFEIEDLESTNGTKVNGKRIRSARLAPGDVIQIGHTILEFVVDD
jgi:pSer/pThr/pTyr-binding forkhead associated (FHA) protein